MNARARDAPGGALGTRSTASGHHGDDSPGRAYISCVPSTRAKSGTKAIALTVPGPSDRSANLAANRRRDTEPERRLRSRLHALGLRFRVDHPIRLEGHRLIRPDIVFTRRRIAVFVDGCFWHGCPEHGRRENGRNADYWRPKIATNRERDELQTRALKTAGWTVLRVWEHEHPSDAALRIAELVRSRSPDRATRPD